MSAQTTTQILQPVPADPVPQRYRGVWRRTLLQTPTLHDITTTVFWLQTAHWHADIRIPAARPDFSGVTTLADCSRAQLEWLATQQGFAGSTAVTVNPTTEICAWHRMLDFQPPAAGPDAGFMTFTPTHLVETGVHGVYLEHWEKLPATDAGFMVLQCLQDDIAAPAAPRLLFVAGDHVMHVRARTQAWPAGLPAGTRLGDAADLQAAPGLLDFEIAIGERTAAGWQIRHATLPWREGTRVEIRLTPAALNAAGGDPLALRVSEGDTVTLWWDDMPSRWYVLEWQPPDAGASV